VFRRCVSTFEKRIDRVLINTFGTFFAPPSFEYTTIGDSAKAKTEVEQKTGRGD